MSGRNRTLVVLGAVAMLAAQTAAAQIVRGASPQQRGWLGISYAADVSRVNGSWRAALVIHEVVGGSPAQRAGIQAGDTLVAINDIRATEQLMNSLGGSLVPGDEVRLKVRRDGREQELRLRAGDVPPEFANRMRPSVGGVYRIDPDSLSGRISIYLDSARRQIDAMPRIYFDTLRGGRGFFRDSMLLRTPDDSVFFWRRPGAGGFTFILPDSGGRVFRADSTLFRYNPDFGAFRFRMDSIIRFDMDSLRVTMRALSRPDWDVRFDTLFRGPGNYGIAILGSRAIAGAELIELNPDLGAYFGTSRGVLVVRVPEGTPADNAGLEAGDVILSVNGTDIGSVRDLRREISSFDAAATIRLDIMRRNTRRTINLRQD
jgi:hypothetical protein